MRVDESEHPAQVLLVEDHEATCHLIESSLATRPPAPRVHRASTVAQACALVDGGELDLVIAGPGLDAPEGLDLIDRVRRIDVGLPVILIAGDDQEEAAATALQRGAEEYLPLRGSALARLPFLIRRAAARRRARVGGDMGQDLLRSLSHELRSPLAGLTALVEMISGGADGALSSAQAARLKRIRASVERLAGVVDQISDLARLSSGRLPLVFGPVDFASILRDAEDSLIAEALTRGVDLRVSVPEGLPVVVGDANRLGQALRHAISAVLRNTASGTIEVTAHARDSRIEVIIREWSGGIPVEAAPPDLLLDTPAADDLGLSIAAGLLRLHGGSLRRAGDGDGANLLCFTLPVERREPPARRESADPIRPSP